MEERVLSGLIISTVLLNHLGKILLLLQKMVQLFGYKIEYLLVIPTVSFTLAFELEKIIQSIAKNKYQNNPFKKHTLYLYRLKLCTLRLKLVI